ncbi:Collagen alpha-1(XVII) chain [Liparis tanakae]|uniref:Collagen alpha-1(XVII) chain n=1 Tax=Liparis tanakae TaxID=230148 RepID=A0A4Z2IVH1_9TELE|nr:Collagen alpha-1(XVII) chain [Liparis tanakae]
MGSEVQEEEEAAEDEASEEEEEEAVEEEAAEVEEAAEEVEEVEEGEEEEESSSSGGARRTQTAGSAGGLSPVFRERKIVSSRSGGYDGTELDDVKKLLKGRSCSVSPTRSSITLPVPKKASVETKTASVASQSGIYRHRSSTSFVSGVRSAGFQTIDTSGLYDTGLTSRQFDTGVKLGHCDVGLKSGQYDTGVRSAQYDTGVRSAQYDTGVRSAQYDTGVRSGQYDSTVRSGQYDSTVRSGQYDTLDATLPSFSWSTSTLPSASTTVVAGNAGTYQSGNNNMSGGSAPLGLTSPSSLSATRSHADDSYKKDKFLMSDKENFPAKRDTEMLIMAKDTGKQFSSGRFQMGGGSISGDSLKKEKLVSSYTETMPLKSETGNSYCE